MNILLNRLLTILNNEDPASTNFHMAFLFLNHLYDLRFLSIGEAAELCSVSKSTISKFVREIGFDDYADFRLSAIEAIRGVQYNWGENITDYISEKGIASYLKILQEDIKGFQTSVDQAKVDELAGALMKYQKVAAFGVVYSETAAIDLQYKLAFRRKIIYTNLSDVKQEEYINNADENTLIIIFSNSGRYLDEYQMIEGSPKKSIFNKTKARIAAITSNALLARDPRVDYCVHFSYSSTIQNHPIYFQIISDMLAVSYEKLLARTPPAPLSAKQL